MAAPVVFAPCSEAVRDEADFLRLNASAGGNPEFEPLVTKAAYAFGTMLDIFESVSQLLRHQRVWDVTYRSAFGVFASAVVLLGRCVTGNDTTRGGSGPAADTCRNIQCRLLDATSALCSARPTASNALRRGVTPRGC